MNKAKSKQAKFGQYERQFVLPITLEDCRARLEMPRQKTRRIQTETTFKVNTWSLDADTTTFEVYQTLLSLDFGRPATRAYGTLNRQADGTTMVLVNAGTSRFGYARFWVFWLFLWISITGGFLVNDEFRALCVLSPLLLMWIVWNARRIFAREHCQLLLVILEALGRLKKNRRDLGDCSDIRV